MTPGSACGATVKSYSSYFPGRGRQVHAGVDVLVLDTGVVGNVGVPLAGSLPTK